MRWSIALLVSAAIAISYLDRQTLPWAIKAIQADIPFSNQIKAGLDSAAVCYWTNWERDGAFWAS